MDGSIKLKNVPDCGKYNPLDPVVQSTISISVVKDTPVISIEYGLRGIAECTRYEPIWVDNVLTYIPLSESFTLFDIEKDFLKENEQTGELKHMDASGNVLLKRGDPLTIESTLSFLDIESQICLPSSTQNFGFVTSQSANVSFKYESYVKITRFRRFLKIKKLKTYSCPVIYQAGPVAPKLDVANGKNFTQNKLFKNKVKQFIYDESLGALVPTGMSNSHGKSRFVRQLWDSNYRRKNYDILTRSIPITLSLTSQPYVYLNEPLLQQLNSTMLFKVSSDDIFNSNEFSFNGQSTKLGYFFIESIEIFADFESTMFIKNKRSFQSHSKSIFCFCFKDNPIEFDLKDLDHNKETHSCAFPVSCSALMESHPKGKMSIMEIQGKDTIVTTCYSDHYFDNQTNIRFVLTISDSDQSCCFELKTTLSLGFMPHSNYSLVENDAPPPYI